MAKKNESRALVSFKCSNCGRINYRLSKNVKNTPDKLSLNKFCPKCRKAVEHKETKNNK